MSEQTLHFDNAREASDLTALPKETLSEGERVFGVSLTARDTWLKIEKLMERGVIEVAPLAYMRGRTLNHAFVILDEAQNTTTKQMMMLLTRLGFDAKAVITGDPTQIDLPDKKNSGLLEAAVALQKIDDLAFVELGEADVVRHPLVQKIIRAYRHHRI